MANSISYAQTFQKELDKQVLEGATSGWMEDNAQRLIYNGGKEVKIPKMSLQGLGSYDRDDGYTSGAITFAYETKSLTQDRGRRFRIDSVDVDETSFALAAAEAASEFQRTKVIPEIDAYRYSKLASLAGIRDNYIPVASTVYSTLVGQIGQVLDVTGDEGEVVAIVSRPVYNTLMNSSEISKSIEVSSFTQGEADVQIKKLNGVVLIPVPSARMKSAYTFLTGGTNQEAGGFAATAEAIDINWIICPKSAPVAVSKTDNIKIISPEQNQFADAWDIDYRKYHDLYVGDNAVNAIAVSLNTAD